MNINVEQLRQKFKKEHQISEYVSFNMYETLSRIEAYLNKKFTSGQTDRLGREKPFFDIGTAAVNVWYRATDIDRKDIKILPTHQNEYINALLATHWTREWMNKHNFGLFLNKWGLTMARYGSAVVKVIDRKDELIFEVVPWNSVIVDPIDYRQAPIVEVFYLNEKELEEYAKKFGFSKSALAKLKEAGKSPRQTIGGQAKEQEANLYELYEIHGVFDGKQMMIIKGKGVDENLLELEEDYSPYYITHLIEMDGRTLSIGAIEHLFEAQWMTNHAMKLIKDQLDIASKTLFYTNDPTFAGVNSLVDLEAGDFLTIAPNTQLAQVNTQSRDVSSLTNYALLWKRLGNEITGVAEQMLGIQPKSGTPWRTTEAILQESYSLFDIMIEQKGLYIEEWFRKHIIPHIKKQLNTDKEIAVILEDHDIKRLDEAFIKNTAIKQYNTQLEEAILSGQDQLPDLNQIESNIRQEVENQPGNTRYFKPDAINWKEQFKDMEWKLEVNISGEQRNRAEVMTTLNTALQVMATPEFPHNKVAQKVVGKILETAGVMSYLDMQDLIVTQKEQAQQLQVNNQ